METHNIGRLWRAALVVLAANVVGVTALWAKYAVNVHFPGERRGLLSYAAPIVTSPFGQGLLALGLGSVVLLGCLRAWGWWRLGAASSLVELAVGVAGFLVNLFATFS